MFAVSAQKAGPLLELPRAFVRGLRGVCGAQARQRQPHGLGQRQLVGLHILPSVQIPSDVAGGGHCAAVLDEHVGLVCYVEGDEGHLLGEQVQNQTHRTSPRHGA